MTLKNNTELIEWSFSIGYFERYVNSKSDYLELLLIVYKTLLLCLILKMFDIIQIKHLMYVCSVFFIIILLLLTPSLQFAIPFEAII